MIFYRVSKRAFVKNLDASLLVDLDSHQSVVNDMVLIGNNLLASSSWDTQVKIWNLISYQVKFNLTGHTDKVFGLKLVNMTLLASASQDTTVRLWNIVFGKLVAILRGHTNAIYGSIDLFELGVLITGSSDQEIKLWNIETKHEKNSYSTNFTIQSLTLIN